MRVSDRLPDRALLALVRTGDHEAFGVLFDRYGQVVHGFCARRCGDRGRAEDLMSLVFLEAWRCRRRMVLVEDCLRPWLLGVATNVLRHEARSRRRHQDALRRFSAAEADVEPDRAATVDDVMTSALLAEAARRAISDLPRREREVAELCLVEQLTTAGAAAALGVREGAVRYRLGRARSHLQRVLDRPGEEPAVQPANGHQVGVRLGRV